MLTFKSSIMNKKILLLAICFTMINSFMFGQAWKIGGNPNADVPLPGGEFGTNGNRFVIFETNGTERARMLNDDGHGFWGFGEKAPNARVHITSPAGEDPFRVTADGNSALYVNQNSGVSVGVGFTPPSHGLYVWGYTGLGTTDPKTRLHVTGGTDASPGGGGYITTGVLTSTNVTLDDNEIMARNNGAAADFFINHNGGNVVIDGSNSGSKVGIGITPTRDLDINHGVGSGANHGLRLRNNGGNNEDWTLYTENSTGDLTFYTDGSTKASIDEKFCPELPCLALFY